AGAGLFTDPDGDVLTYASPDLPSWATLNPATGEVTGTVPGGATGTIGFTLQATDGQGGSASATVRIEVAGAPPGILGSASAPLPGDAVQDVPWVHQVRIAVDGVVERAAAGERDLLPIRPGSADGILLRTVNGIGSLDALTPGVDTGPFSPGLARIDRFAGTREGVFAAGEPAARSWLGSSLALAAGEGRGLAPRGEGGLALETFVRARMVIVEAHAAGRTAEVGAATVTLADGRPAPEWVRMARPGLLVIERPADVRLIDLRFEIVLSDGSSMVRTVSIDLATGIMRDLGELGETDTAGGAPRAALFGERIRAVAAERAVETARVHAALAAVDAGGGQV
ncbi:MAG: putative Ig domain-containing protein, partial [Alphaproteobacteria bacterium]|nr:putative Ig domain-containing protein [Alphaproteobacteria bacterium]MDX5368231.1 putative Ig domain-containing protein [Alphaproteobacteria bacterium]MDX5463040.1 putative Ig domain-containing protein [Alphaproteobacteria bacterium]